MKQFLRFVLLLLTVACACSAAFSDVQITVTFAPPELPVYDQPVCPNDGYIWVPGYWAYGPYGYFWVPGTWVQPPEVGYLWTPGYWAFADDQYEWFPGYWAPQVGYYGGINYGYGYFGQGYQGGYWRDRQFYYNRSVNNVNVTNVTNVYNTTVVNNNTTNVTRVSYNGGPVTTAGQVAWPPVRRLNRPRYSSRRVYRRHPRRRNISSKPRTTGSFLQPPIMASRRSRQRSVRQSLRER